MAQQALWSGRFEGEADESTLSFTSSLDTDAALGFYDVMGSLAHVKMLKKCAVIPEEDADSIIGGLKKIAEEMDKGTFEIDDSLEDIHTCVEFRLTELIGPAGGKLHTGRSRNDQVATDFRMFLRDAVLEIVEKIEKLRSGLTDVAERNTETVMPGFTHMQHAQPVTLAHHLMAYVWKFGRDSERLLDCYERMNECPLGSAALAGTTYPIDRKMTSDALGFRKPTDNSMDSVSGRDFAAELAFCSAMIADHLSSLSEELVLWSSQEFGFVEMDDRYSTGSSIMPQKKNPDIAELIRGRTGNSIGYLVSIMTMLKGLPLTYNRDLQEDKGPVISSLQSVADCLDMMYSMISTMKVNKERMRGVLSGGYINATDLADYLAVKGIPFREAHGIVGAAVRYCISSGKNLEELKIEELKKFSNAIEEDVYNVLSVEQCVKRRNSLGGTSPVQVSVQIKDARESIEKTMNAVTAMNRANERCWSKLLA
ncbi:MAG: argininosuccinate lyase [Candidatus Methanomethylophilaceae archaeon]|jgi:argininosuccinate lyase